MENVITINPDGTRSKTKDKSDKAWEELKTSKKSKKEYLTGVLDSVEPMRISKTESIVVGVAYYDGYRVVIPMTEMNINLGEKSSKERISRIMSSMIGSDIDFVVTDYDDKERKCIGSRAKAMQRKIEKYYLPNKQGKSRINENDIVEARVTAVGDTAVRVEVMGAECFVRCNRLDPEWISNARDRYFIGQVLDVRMEKIVIKEDGEVKIEVESKSLKKQDNVNCSVNGRYLGTVTGREGPTYYIRLKAGVNAIAYQYAGPTPLPEINDEVIFICTKMDKNSHLAFGVVNRIARRNN